MTVWRGSPRASSWECAVEQRKGRARQRARLSRILTKTKKGAQRCDGDGAERCARLGKRSALTAVLDACKTRAMKPNSPQFDAHVSVMYQILRMTP